MKPFEKKSEVLIKTAEELGVDVNELLVSETVALEDLEDYSSAAVETPDYHSMDDIPYGILMRGWSPKEGD